jgi:undecaprenyl-diphosphatase
VGVLLEAALLGVVQGLTEFLPVSSSGHLILARAFFGWDGEQFGLPFDVACHVGTLAAILFYFRHDLVALLEGIPYLHRPGAHPAAMRLWFIALATIPAVIVGGAFGDVIDGLRTPAVIAATLGTGGLLMVLAERQGAHRRGHEGLTLGEAMAIGIAQACALVPGVSRSGATITMALFLGLTREAGARFSFVLGVPAMLGAATLESVKLARSEVGIDAMTAQVFVIGMVVSGVVGYLTVRFFLRYLVSHTLNAFAAYRMALAAATILWLLS